PVDCNDQDPTVHPGAAEICDGKDNDCDGQCDEPFDADGDRYTTCGSKRLVDGTCELPLPSRIDCHDQDPAVQPGPAEVGHGQRGCNDATPPGFTGACMQGPDLAPSEYCTAYGGCDLMSTARDKLACTAEATPAKILVCDVTFSLGALCANAVTTLPGPTTGT